jgi:hypothetical protein
MREAEFEIDPYDFLCELGPARAVELVRRYRSEFTGGWFESLIDLEHPNEITEQDLVAVECLSVRVPVRVSIWILDQARDEITRLLGDERLRPDRDLWECELSDLGPGSPADELWKLLQGDSWRAFWPVGTPSRGIGPVTAGKLLAAKRPRTVPVVDEVVREALRAPRGRFWESMWRAMQNAKLRRALESIREEACREEACVPTLLPRARPSLLRTLDIAVWMRGPRDPRARRPIA